MNKLIMTSLAAGLFLLAPAINASAFRGGQGSAGFHMGSYDTSSVSPEAFASFNKETVSLREKMIDKSSEIRKENIKTKPDQDKIAKLRKEMIDIQADIQKVADKYGITGRRGGRGKGYRGERGWN